MLRKVYDFVCSEHPEVKAIFDLAIMLQDKTHIPYRFSFDDEMKPTPFDKGPKDPRTEIDWEHFDFCVFIDCIPGILFVIRPHCGTQELDVKIESSDPSPMDAEKVVEYLQLFFKK